MQRRISAILLIAMLAGCVACGESEIKQHESTTVTESTAAELTMKDILGFEKEDNGGKKFTIYADSNKSYEYDAEEITGDVVSDAVYEKNKSVEDYLGIEFDFRYAQCDWAVLDDFHATITNDIISGTGEIDLVSSVMVCTMPIVSNGYFLEGKSLEYANFDHAWWLSDMYDRFSIAGKLYGFLGDASLSLYKDMSVIFFNKRIWDEFKAPDPYELVRNNEWTLDKFIEVCSGMSNDLNGDGAYTLEDDQLSFLAERVPAGTFQTALELKMVELDKDGTPKYVGLTERFQTAFEKLQKFYSGDDMITMYSIDDHSYKTMKTFAEGRVGSMVNFIYSTEYMRDMKDDYGIVPIPKYDENQEQYHAQLGTSTTMLFVPVTTKSPELTSKVMESLAYYGNKLVAPKYYEVALKEKYARDNEIHEMLDLIRDGASLDFLFVYGTSLKNPPFQYFRFAQKDVNLASDLDSKKDSFIASLEELTDAISKLEQ